MLPDLENINNINHINQQMFIKMILKTIHSEMKPLRMKHFDMTIPRHSQIISIKMF